MIGRHAKEVIKVLSNMKIETIMLTGDNNKTAEKIANESMNIIQHMKDEFISTYSVYINNGVKTKVNDILYEIFKHYTKKELEEL